MDYKFNSGWDIPDEVDEMIREDKEDLVMVKNDMNNVNEANIIVANEKIAKLVKLVRSYDLYTSYIDDSKQYRAAERRNKEISDEYYSLCNKIGISVIPIFTFERMSDEDIANRFKEEIAKMEASHSITNAIAKRMKENKDMSQNTVAVDSVSNKEDMTMTNNTMVLAMSTEDLKVKTRDELREIAKVVSLKGYSRMKKDALVEALASYCDPSKKLVMVEIKEDKEENIMTRQTNLDKAKEVIKEFVNRYSGFYGLYNTKNTVGDSLENIYNDNDLKIDICYGNYYFEVFGLTEEEFGALKDFYNELQDQEEEETNMTNTVNVAVVADQVTAIPVPVPVATAEVVTATPVVVESTEDRIVTRIDANTVNISYPKGLEIKAEGCNPNKTMTVTVEKPAPKRVVDYSAMSPKEKTDGVIREVRAIAANNKKKGYGTNITAFMLTAIICKYLGIPNLKKGLAEGTVTDEIKANANKVRDYLVNKGIIRIAVIQDAANFRFYDPSIYDGSVKGLYDATKYQKTGVCKPVSYKVF